MKRLIVVFSFLAGFYCMAAVADNSTNAVYEPWGSIHSLPETSSLLGVEIYHGPIFIPNHSRSPIRGDIYFSHDHRRILVVPEPGPIFASTNSGLSWTVFNKAGTYQFPVSSGSDGTAMFIEVTLDADVLAHSPLKPSTNRVPNWYASGVGRNGNGVIVSADASEPSPLLTIQRQGSDIVLSWPASFTDYRLQQNIDLDSTNWMDMTNAVNVVGDENQVTAPFSIENHFFRLKSQ